VGWHTALHTPASTHLEHATNPTLALTRFGRPRAARGAPFLPAQVCLLPVSPPPALSRCSGLSAAVTRFPQLGCSNTDPSLCHVPRRIGGSAGVGMSTRIAAELLKFFSLSQSEAQHPASAAQAGAATAGSKQVPVSQTQEAPEQRQERRQVRRTPRKPAGSPKVHHAAAAAQRSPALSPPTHTHCLPLTPPGTLKERQDGAEGLFQ
jgi:hypothetical protein